MNYARESFWYVGHSAKQENVKCICTGKVNKKMLWWVHVPHRILSMRRRILTAPIIVNIRTPRHENPTARAISSVHLSHVEGPVPIVPLPGTE